jgi:hypothetical protein
MIRTSVGVQRICGEKMESWVRFVISPFGTISARPVVDGFVCRVLGLRPNLQGLSSWQEWVCSLVSTSGLRLLWQYPSETHPPQ